MACSWQGFLRVLILACLPSLAFALDLPAARDLREEAREAGRLKNPLIVLYSRRDCPHCQRVKQEFLQPLLRDERYRGLLIREILQDSPQPLVDFVGKSTTHAAFAAAKKVKLVPILAFYGVDGEFLADPIVGVRLPDFYLSYLEQSIDQARRRLRD